MKGIPPPEYTRNPPGSPGKPHLRFHREHTGDTRHPRLPPSPLPAFPHTAPLRVAPASPPLPWTGESARVPRGYTGRLREIPGFPGGQTRVQRGFSRKFREFRHFFLPGNPGKPPVTPMEHPCKPPPSRSPPRTPRGLPRTPRGLPRASRGPSKDAPRILQGYPGDFPGGSRRPPGGTVVGTWFRRSSGERPDEFHRNLPGISSESPGNLHGIPRECPGVYKKGPRPFGRGPLYRGYTA